jgi:hypothetical protein
MSALWLLLVLDRTGPHVTLLNICRICTFVAAVAAAAAARRTCPTRCLAELPHLGILQLLLLLL